MKKLAVFLCVVCAMLCNMGAFGAKNVGLATWQDTRRYVSDEEWAAQKYNKFVRLNTSVLGIGVDICTAQYVAPNIILSAGHCVQDGATYTIDRADKKGIPVKVIKYKYNNKKDWALFVIEDPEFYKDEVFNVTVAKYDTTDIPVMNAGWGTTKILSESELNDIRTNAAQAGTGGNFVKHYQSTIKDTESRMKASDHCNILNKKDNNDVYNGALFAVYNDKTNESRLGIQHEKFAVDCVTVQGNSGGGIVSQDGNDLYGIVSYGLGDAAWLISRGSVNVMSDSKQFIKQLEKAKQKYPLQTDNVPVQEQERNDVDNDDDDGDDPVKTSPVQAAGKVVDKINKEISSVCDDIDKKFDKIEEMTDAELTVYMDRVSYCQERKEVLEKLQDAYEKAKENEQSLANRSLTALTTAATGIGAMELAQGLSEQAADKDAAADMAAYIETFRCEYANGKSVKAGPDEIELPGGNDQNLMNLRAEYFALANDLKERKTALGMKPGIESEEILDKSNLGLYDDESTGITSGSEASLYRAQMLKSEEDQSKIDAASETSQKRVKGGAIAAGAGVAGGVLGDSLINGEIGEKIKSITNKQSTKENDRTISLLKNKLTKAGVLNVDRLNLSGYDISSLANVIQNKDFSNLRGKDITNILNTTDTSQFSNQFLGIVK